MKTGLFLSSCDNVVGAALDLATLAKHYTDLTSVKIFDNFYDPDDFASLMAEVKEKELDSLVLAGDSPMVFSHTRNGDYIYSQLAQNGINTNRVEIVNLKNMVVRAHSGSRRDLLAKAQALVNVGLAKIRSAQDLTLLEISPRKSVAVLGSNSGAIAVSQLLLDAGFKVTLISKEEEFILPMHHKLLLQPTLTSVVNHPRFTRFTNANVLDFHGFAGDFVLAFGQADNSQSMPFGAVVLSPEGKKGIEEAYKSHFHVNFDDTTSFRSRDDHTSRNRTRSQGIYVINPTRQDNDVADILQAADATAADVINLLNHAELYHQVTVSEVDEELCGACGACVKTCMFHAVSMSGTPAHSAIDARRCQGCGNCVTACPAGARDLIVCPTNYLFEAVDILSRFQPPGDKSRMLAIACDGCGYQCFDNAPEKGLKWPIGILPLWTVCGGQIDTQLLMHAFTKGFDGVALLICAEGCCHNIVGNVDLERRLNLFKQILESRGIPEDRLRVISTCSTSDRGVIDGLKQFYGELEGVPLEDDSEPVENAANALFASSPSRSSYPTGATIAIGSLQTPENKIETPPETKPDPSELKSRAGKTIVLDSWSQNKNGK